MTPQGVVPSIQIGVGEGNYSEFANGTIGTVADGDNLLLFGDTAPEGTKNLNGYQVGNITTGSFQLVLNGFKNNTEFSMITCSFDRQLLLLVELAKLALI